MVIKIKYGLGNQMFQYAFAKALQKNGDLPKLPWISGIIGETAGTMGLSCSGFLESQTGV